MLSFGNQYSAAGSLSGTGTVVFGGRQTNGLLDGSGLSGADGTLTIGAGITIRGSQGSIINNSDAQIINQGTISADTVGGAITVGGGLFINQGTLDAAGGTLNLNNTWTNTGTTIASAVALNIMGALNNTGSTLALSGTTGSFNLAGGTIQGGTISGSGGASLVIVVGGTLEGVTCNANLDLQTYNRRDFDRAGWSGLERDDVPGRRQRQHVGASYFLGTRIRRQEVSMGPGR